MQRWSSDRVPKARGMMKAAGVALLAGLLLTARLLAGGSNSGQASAEPRPLLWCPSPTQVIKPRQPNDGTVVLFPVFNHGTRRLVLTPAAEGCACSDDVPIIIAPRGRHNIAVTLPSAKGQGPWRHSVRFTSNDPACPHLELIVVAEAAPGDNLSARRD